MNDDVARTRWFILNLSRLAGVALVIVGLLVTQGAITWPVEVGYVMILLGIVDVFVVPQVLARRWRSPKE
jgi:membrane protein YdbS with pleckstrin-like domain